jgi:hypothetical protein
VLRTATLSVAGGYVHLAPLCCAKRTAEIADHREHADWTEPAGSHNLTAAFFSGHAFLLAIAALI